MPSNNDAAFDPRVAGFFTELARHNDRDWFTAHRDEYDELVRGPLESLATDAAEYGPARLFRPNRDVRFSPNKQPYKLNGGMWAGTVGGIYLEVDATGVSTGGGLYEPTRDQLQRARAAIDESPRAGRELDRVMGELTANGFEIFGPGLKTAPRGYSRDHPRIDLLRLQHYAALTRLPHSATRAEIHGAWRSMGPLIEWAQEFVGPALSWP